MLGTPAARSRCGSRGPLAPRQICDDAEIIGHAVLNPAQPLLALVQMHPPPRFVQLEGHNHFTTVWCMNTSADTLGPEIRKFVFEPR